MRLFATSAVLALGLSSAAFASDIQLALAYVGQDAVFVDMTNLTKKDDVASFRFLKVVQDGKTIMEHPYNAAWQEATIDCKTHQYRALSQVLLLKDGNVGAKRYLQAEAVPITLGTPEAGLQDAVCKGTPDYSVKVATVGEAMKVGHERMQHTQSATAPSGSTAR